MPPADDGQLLENLIRLRRVAEEEEARQRAQWRPARLLRRDKPAFTAQPAPSRTEWRSNLTIGALGITLGLICALFPWYIFFNQEAFGPPSIVLGGSAIDLRPAGSIGGGPERAGATLAVQEREPALDPLATGAAKQPNKAESAQDEAADQPFPAPPVPYHLVFISGGRAMIEDASGLFLVEPGSVLPDSSRVAAIEQRDGRWVLVTSADEVLELPR